MSTSLSRSSRPDSVVGKIGWVIRKVASLPLFELTWALPAWVLLGLTRAVVLKVPFRKLTPRLGVRAGNTPWVPLLTPRQEHRADRIGRVVRRSAMFTPWESNCFNQAITARILLGLYRVPYCLIFGARLTSDGRTIDGKELNAHAWVAAGRIRVTGATSFGHYPVVGCFVSPPLAKVMGLEPAVPDRNDAGSTRRPAR